MPASLSVDLKVKTPREWIECVLGNFNLFLVDHAACERKASAMGMTLVTKYPDRPELVDQMIAFAKEELQHFYLCWRLLHKRGLQLAGDVKSPYMNQLMKLMREPVEERFLDRLLCIGIVEARGSERFHLVANSHPDEEIRAFYSKLAEAEDRHHELFVEQALRYFDTQTVQQRLCELLEAEAKIVLSLPIRAAVH